MSASEDILEIPAPRDGERLAYGSDPYHFGDLRLPVSAGPHPVVIGIHGGYYRARYGLAYFGHACAALTALGFATWNIEYRRLGNPGGGWPGTFIDIAAAADHLRALAETYPLDLARVVTLGISPAGWRRASVLPPTCLSTRRHRCRYMPPSRWPASSICVAPGSCASAMASFGN